MFLKVIFLLLFVTVLVYEIDAAKILAYFPFPAISHQIVFRPLTQELAKRGHQMTIITPEPAFKNGTVPPNMTEIDVHDISYEIWRKVDMKKDGGLDDTFNIMRNANRKLVEIIDSQINTKEVQDIIKTKQFDLILVEAIVRGSLVMSHIFKVPLIQVSSFGSVTFLNEAIGAPSHPLLNPEPTIQRIYNLSLWEKINGLIQHFKMREISTSIESDADEMIKRNFGPTAPTIKELQNNIDMLFLNINPIWSGNQPVPPNVINIGGLHQLPMKELPNDLKTYLDSSKHGVIYISFGTSVDPTQLPNERIQIFCKVFSKLHYDVLWKWNSDELPGRPENVRISKWLPQSDLLRHPKIKLFITQGGLQSTDETISAGVPVIAFPILADQWYNAEKYVYHKIGLKMELKDLTEESFEEAIKKVIDDHSYRNNVKRLGVLMRDQPQSPLERAVWWTEYVLRHGGAKHLRSPAANISWAEYLILDVFAALLGVAVIVVLILFICIKFVLHTLKTVFVVKSKSKKS